MKEIKKFTISRKIWLRGEGGDNSRLHRETDNKMCCVGIYLEACGIPRKKLTDRRVAHCVLHPSVPEWLDHNINNNRYSSDIAIALYEANDASHNQDQTREETIAKLFLDQGIEVEFVD